MSKLDPALILFALIAGYAWIWTSNRLRYETYYVPWEQTLFQSAVRGLGLFLAVRAAYLFAYVPFLEAALPTRGLRFALQQFAPFPYAPSWIMALTFGLLLAWYGNRTTSSREGSWRAMREYGGELVKLLCQAADEQLAVCVVLKSRKFYFGYVVVRPNVSDKSRYTKILPSASGYRHPETLAFCPTVSYADAFAELRATTIRPGSSHSISFGHVLPLDEVASAFFFDADIYEKHFKAVGGPATATQPAGS